MNQSSKKNMVAGVIVVAAVLLLGAILWYNNAKNDPAITYETEQYKSFLSDVEHYVQSMDPNLDSESAKMEVISEVIELQKKYDDASGVSYAANQLIGSATSAQSNTQGFLDQLLSKIKDLASTIIKITEPTTALTMRSNTVCDNGEIDAKYCTSQLNAKVYITDKKSDKWAVLIHGYSMSGKQMYNAVGDMYASQGYNVLAPDLRGAGDTVGAGSMGYLESLDVYDWIKDLNENWSSRYGVTVAPETIVVHGISLGGATTLQLATNPDIAAASGGPYTQNLTQLHVKGFVDDCGYTSMSGIITGMLSLGNSFELSKITSWLGLEEIDLFEAIQTEAEKLNLNGLINFDPNSITNNKDLSQYLDQFSNSFHQFTEIEIPDGYLPGTGQIEIPDGYLPGTGQIEIPDGYLPGTGQIEIPDGYLPDSDNNWWNSLKGMSIKETMAMDGTNNLGDLLIKKVLLNLVGVGLTEENYDKYANVFSEGRRFPQDSNVVIIHGTSDTTVPHDNADAIAQHILTENDAHLLYKWDVSGQPHAFIVAGFHKDEYTNLIGNFANCMSDSKQCSVFDGSDLPLKQISKQ